MLTEDIDSSMRVLLEGRRIVSDPGIVSTELAPTTWSALWAQRMRWAQGWSKVSLRHLVAALRSRRLTRRQKLGVMQLLGWRELYPWLSLQIFPVLACWLYRDEPAIEWFVPLLVASTLFTASVGPAQALAGYRQASPAKARDLAYPPTQGGDAREEVEGHSAPHPGPAGARDRRVARRRPAAPPAAAPPEDAPGWVATLRDADPGAAGPHVDARSARASVRRSSSP